VIGGATAARFEVGIAGAGVLANTLPRATVAARVFRIMGDLLPLSIINEETEPGFRMKFRNLLNVC
jgi:hypothetical protein